MDDVEVVESLPEGAEVDGASEEPSAGDADLLKQALMADEASMLSEEDAPAAPLTGAAERAKAREEKAAAAERARAERRRGGGLVDEAEAVASRARAMERELAASLERAKRLEQEREAEIGRFRKAISEKGLEGLSEFGFDYSTLTAAELDRHDPQFLAKKAIEEAQALRREIAERDRREQETRHAQRMEQATREDHIALVSFAEQASDLSPQVAELAKAARTNGRAARILIETADEVKDYYVREHGRLPYMPEVVKALDAQLDFLQGIRGRGPAPAPVSSQAPRPTHQRTLGSPAAADRVSARRELTDDELFELQAKQLRDALDADRQR